MKKTDTSVGKLNIALVAAGVVLIAVSAVIFALTGDKGCTVTTYSMGSYVQQTVYGKNGETAAQAAASAVAHLDDLISWRIEKSDVWRLNDSAGVDFVDIDPVTREILETSLAVCRESGGAFDITVAPVSRLWDFDDKPHLPDSALIERFKNYVNYDSLSVLDDGTAALRKTDTALDLGAVGKGAGCDAAVKAYKENNVDHAIVAVGGSVGVYGNKPFGKGWTVAVRDPAGQGAMGTLTIYDGFVSTSGSYEKFFEQDGVRYHHILDPKTGYPAESGLVSVTVKSDSGALSDALSTACFVLGLEDSLPLLEKFGAEGIFITDENKVYVTEGLSDSFEITNKSYKREALP